LSKLASPQSQTSRTAYLRPIPLHCRVLCCPAGLDDLLLAKLHDSLTRFAVRYDGILLSGLVGGIMRRASSSSTSTTSRWCSALFRKKCLSLLSLWVIQKLFTQVKERNSTGFMGIRRIIEKMKAGACQQWIDRAAKKW
jgi:hypothetical protein